MELNNITLVEWVDQAFDHSFTKKNIKYVCKVANIWPYICKAKDNRIQPSNIYKQHKTMKLMKMIYTSYEQYDQEYQCEDASTIIKFFHIHVH